VPSWHQSVLSGFAFTNRIQQMSLEFSDEQLWQDYRTSRSDAAFASLARRYADLVYSAALRQTRNPGLAEEATQAVFLALVRKASSIRDGSVVAGWLIVAARREALGILRQHARRAERELRAATMNSSSSPNPLDDAWHRIEPLLDEGLAALRETDRNAVVLHFLRRQTFRDVGAALGFSEEAARKRVSRALEVLRDFLAARGVAYPASTVAGVMAAFAVQPAPAAIAAGVTAALAGADVASSSLFTIFSTQSLILMAWTKTKTIIVAAVTVAAIPVAMQ
jgi:RNA polymerase sigma factor (sigma-70 family)